MQVTTQGRNRYPAYSGDVTQEAAHGADVSLVLGFLNTLDVEKGTDLLRRRDSWDRWAVERGLRPDPLPAARQVREAMRAAVGDPRARPTGGPAGATVRVELSPQGPVLAPRTAVEAALAAASRLAVLDQWQRIKICPADDCRWAFYDHSRNRSRSWCSMQLCGNREKARAWRRRTTGSS